MNGNDVTASVGERILRVAKDLGLSKNAFEKSIGRSSGYMNMLRKKDSTPGVDVILKIIEVYPEVNLNWLMTGKMSTNYLCNEDNLVLDPKNEHLYATAQSFTKVVHDLIDERLANQFHLVRKLKKEVDQLKAEINQLKQKQS